ncbi:rhamnogalacturonan acetylesterase [Muricauda sp. CAU 1633]|uniref:rhamnogalacturonan acetylesterase n=1 Tax=Allomuricauda sp. CAU 1633 TaxID=2816036 RepID=UPI001A8DB49C|nr:rhamnogalacturonan acetylesterase [Muricauda sp. CAU 1633]MBO0324083.1 rhamnogalacturonan acetylesterase [Muricauda sp. CAU 1633]
MKVKGKTVLLLLLISTLFVQCNSKVDEKPTVYTVGDSTVKNGRGDGAGGLWGWGDFIGQFLDSTKVNVENHALGGTSSRTYQNLGLWDTVNNKLKKGDFVLIQFGHNDDGPINDDFRARGTIKGIGEETEEIDNILTGKHEIVHSYGWYIRKIVTQTKEKGGIPIVVSPIPRNIWENGKVPRNDESYGLWAKQIAEEEGVTFVDLNGKMVEVMNAEGEEKVTGSYFYKKDHTHTSARGAMLASKLISDELLKSDVSLKDYILDQPKIVLPKKKNIFLIGDSTMANNGDENAVGWGVPFPIFFDTTRVNIINKARGGRSTRTFEYEGLWEAAKKEFQKGDFVLIQFGHNDAGNIDKAKFRGSLKGIGDETQNVIRPDSITETVHTFGWYMKKYIQEVKEKGAVPIVLSLTPRNEWPNGKVERRDDTYVKWSRETAEMENAFYLDINDSIAVRYENVGKETVKPFFPRDHTHTGKLGAEFSAQTIATALKNLKECGIRDYIEISQ